MAGISGDGAAGEHSLTTMARNDENSPGKRSRGTQDQEENPCKAINKRRFVYGNYDQYYGYRILKDFTDDPRLKYFKKGWFEGKDCLDIGCNTGNLTISVAKSFSCRSMVGVDIDSGLVHRAQKLLQDTANSLKGSKISNLTNVSDGGKSQNKFNGTSNGLASNSDGLTGEELLQRVSFRKENIIASLDVKMIYDTVLCLSVTKWVHLNWGDCGLIRLFAKIRNLLRPGGILVLEAQAWKSYKSNHLVSEVVRQNYHEIVLRPDQFKELLLDRIGFRSMQRITEEVTASVKGFNRPIYLVER